MRGSANRSFGIEVAQLAGVNKSVTDNAKSILKTLEATDTLRKNTDINNLQQNCSQEGKVGAEIERILKDVDVNNVSPMQAFNILVDLKEKLKG